MPPNKRCALSLRGDDDGELGVASRPNKKKFYGLHEKANSQQKCGKRGILKFFFLIFLFCQLLKAIIV